MSYNGTQADQLFTTAVDIVTSRLPRTGSAQVSYSSKLALYALYKQATEGDVTTSRPGMLDMLGRAKHDAWRARKGMNDKEAKTLYVESLAKILKAAEGDALSQSLYRELQSQANQPLSSETESDSESGSESEESEDSRHDQPQVQPQSTSLVGAIRREASQGQPAKSSAYVEEERETIAPLPASTLLHESQHSLPSLPTSSYVALPGGPSRAIRSAGGYRTPAEQLLTLSSSQLKQDWLAEQQWRQHSQQQQQAPLPATMTEAHLQAHNRSSARPAPSPRPPSVRSVPVPLESTLQAIHTSLQALHERIASLEAESQRNRARRSPWASLLSRCLYVVSLIWRRPDSEGSGYIFQHQQHRRPSTMSIFLGLWDQVRDAILVALLVAFLLRRRRMLLDWSWTKRWMPKYRLKLVQNS